MCRLTAVVITFKVIITFKLLQDRLRQLEHAVPGGDLKHTTVVAVALREVIQPAPGTMHVVLAVDAQQEQVVTLQDKKRHKNEQL
jgi:hypothetical protein